MKLLRNVLMLNTAWVTRYVVMQSIARTWLRLQEERLGYS